VILKYIIDITELGRAYKQKITEVLGYATYIPPEAIEHVDYIYKESIMQMVLVMDNHLDDYMLKLVDAPNMSYFAHVKQLNLDAAQDQVEWRSILSNVTAFKLVFKEMALQLAMHIQYTINKENASVEYLLEAVTDTYIVIIKHPRGQL